MNSEFFIQNRKKLFHVSDCDILIFTAHRRTQRNGDSTYSFRQDSSFWYLTGSNESSQLLVISKERSYIILPQLSYSETIFDGAQNSEKIKKVSGVDEVFGHTAGWQELDNDLKKAKTVGYIEPTKAKAVNFVLNDARNQLLQQIRKKVSKSTILKTVNAEIATLRAVKSSEELGLIKKAVSATVEAFETVLAHTVLGSYTKEYEIEAAFDYEFKKRGYQHAYTPIVASGKNACTLHYNANNDAVQNGQLLLVDIGAEVSNYAADITRTVPIGAPTVRQKEILDAVVEIQQFAFQGLRPGISIKENEQRVERYVGTVLKNLGLINQSSQEQIRRFYPHATSHFLGLDVHDVGDYRAPLKSGMVLTVEPGLYLSNENIGVRIEDNVVITEDGFSILSKSLPALLT